jgi:hypothetical protein
MTSLADKVEFARRHWKVKGKEPFEIDEDEWLYQHLWLPLHSYRLWPVNRTKLCDECAALAGTLTQDYYSSDKTRTQHHANQHNCAGLSSQILQFFLLHLKRQSGKTVGTSGFIGAELFKGADQTITLISGSDDQTKRLFEKHYKAPVENNPALEERAKCIGRKIIVPHNRCEFEFVPTSMAGVTGESNSIIIIDEARNVPGDIATAIINSSLAQSGWVCPRYAATNKHTRTKGDLDEPEVRKCRICNTLLIPWAPRIIMMTSAAELKGGNKDWFFEIVDENERDPEPRAYVFASEETVNKRVAQSVVDATSRFLSKAPSLQAAVDIETHNIPRKRGEDVISKAEMRAAEDSTLVEVPRICSEPAVAFCDTATSVDKVSLVPLADDTQHDDRKDPWQYVYVPYLKFWEPQKMPGGVIDEAAVEAALIECVTIFPNLVCLYVDCRTVKRKHNQGTPWAEAMVKRLRSRSPHFNKIVKPWLKTGGESDQGWIDLEMRYRQKRIRHPVEPAIRAEARGIHREFKGDRSVVSDINRSKSHKDILESMAMGCYLVLQQSMFKRKRMGSGLGGEQKSTSRLRLGSKQTWLGFES